MISSCFARHRRQTVIYRAAVSLASPVSPREDDGMPKDKASDTSTHC